MSQVLASGTITSATPSQVFYVNGAYNMSIWGTFAGTVQLERSFDKGVTWLPKTPAESFSAPASFMDAEIESDVAYRLNATSFTSGTLNYRVSQ